MLKFEVSLEIAIEDLVCPHCGEQHQDIDEWALKPHKTHLCLHCGKLFDGSMYAVSNPVIQPKFRLKFASFSEQANGFQTKVFSEPVSEFVELHNLTADYVRKLWKQKNISEVTIRTCSICDHPMRYLVNSGELYIDTSCDCTSYHQDPKHVGWERLVENLNNFTSADHRKECAKLYGFNLL